MRLIVQITNQCAFECSHCAFFSSKNDHRYLSFDGIRGVIDDFAAMKANDFRFSGGEPFTHYDILVQSADYARQKGAARIGCTTNASWATSLKVAHEKLGPLKRAGLNDLRISCDDFHSRTIHLHRVRNAFRAAVELGISTGIKIVVFPGSARASTILRELEDITPDILFFVEELSLLPIGRAGGLPGTMFRHRAGIPPGPCTLQGTFSLDVEKNLYPCCVPGWPELLRLGNISQTSVKDLVAAAQNPLLKILRLKGPAFFAPLLESMGVEIIADSFVNRCHLCQTILNIIHRKRLYNVIELADSLLKKESLNRQTVVDVVKKIWNFD